MSVNKKNPRLLHRGSLVLSYRSRTKAYYHTTLYFVKYLSLCGSMPLFFRKHTFKNLQSLRAGGKERQLFRSDCHKIIPYWLIYLTFINNFARFSALLFPFLLCFVWLIVPTPLSLLFFLIIYYLHFYRNYI